MDSYSDFTIKWASLQWETQQALKLRQRVFCLEQGLFEQNDLDHIDQQAQCLVAIANHGGWPDRVVGTVRIHQYSEGVWWGSRLAVEAEFRAHSGIGAALIRLAVCSAHALNCTQFLAQVQKQNETLFKRLNWCSHYDLDVRGRPHVMMEADLSQYPACQHPYSGYVVKGKVRHDMTQSINHDIAPYLLHSSTHINTGLSHAAH